MIGNPIIFNAAFHAARFESLNVYEVAPCVLRCATDQNFIYLFCCKVGGTRINADQVREGEKTFASIILVMSGFFSPFSAFLFLFFFSPTAVVARFLMKMDGVFFHAHLLKSVETFTSKENGPRDRVQCAADGRIIQGVFFSSYR